MVDEESTNDSSDEFPAEDTVPSPAGWVPPDDVMPGWDWTPPSGLGYNREAMPVWLRILSKLPLLDRYGYELMWHRGGFLVLPPDHEWFERPE